MSKQKVDIRVTATSNRTKTIYEEVKNILDKYCKGKNCTWQLHFEEIKEVK